MLIMTVPASLAIWPLGGWVFGQFKNLNPWTPPAWASAKPNGISFFPSSLSFAEDAVQHTVYLLLDALQTAFIHFNLPFGAFHILLYHLWQHFHYLCLYTLCHQIGIGAELVNVFEMIRVLPFHPHCVFSGFCQRPVLITWIQFWQPPFPWRICPEGFWWFRKSWYRFPLRFRWAFLCLVLKFLRRCAPCVSHSFFRSTGYGDLEGRIVQRCPTKFKLSFPHRRRGN